MKEAKIPMTMQEVEAWIMLKAQEGKRWFGFHVLDEDMQDEPQLAALLESIAEVVYEGMKQAELQERMEAAELHKPNLRGLN